MSGIPGRTGANLRSKGDARDLGDNVPARIDRLLRRQRISRTLAAATLLTMVVSGVLDAGPIGLQAAAQAATVNDEATESSTTTASDAAAAQAAADAKNLGGVGTTAPVVGLPAKDQSPPHTAREIAVETAQRLAQSSKKPVVVDALTTETSLTTAQPDGRFTTETALGAVRYRVDGQTGADDSGKAVWADLDLSLSGQDAGRTTAEASGPWTARLTEQSGANMVAVGPAGQTISWSPSAAAAPVGTGGPSGALPAVTDVAPSAGVTPAAAGVDLEVKPATVTQLPPGQGADAPAPVMQPSPAPGGGTASPTVSSVGSDAVFPDVLKGGRDYTVTVTATGAEESVVIASRSEVNAAGGASAAAVYRNTFTLPAGVTARQASAKTVTEATALGVEFVDAGGAVIATFGGGKAFDSAAKAAGEPSTVPVATRLLAAATGAGTATGSATVEVSVDPAWVADAARVFPLTIDPHIASGTGFSGSTGPNGSNNFDAYVDEAYPTTAEGVQDSGRLLAGYRPINGATKGSTTLVYFNLGDLIGSENTISNAQFSLWNNYSYSCNPTGLWVDAATSSWNPATVTWNTRPGWANAGSMKTFAHGYSSSCAAAAEFYNVTSIVQKWANSPNSYYGGMNNYGFIITANGGDASGYKRFNSAETGSGMPGLTVTWENCTNYPAGAGGSGTRKVCGSIRDAYAANGGPNGFGLPTTNDAATPNGKGYYNHFDKSGQARSIYWSPASGAHTVVGAIRDKWATDGWENSLEGWPSSDDRATPSGEGAYNHFLNLTDGQTRSVYWTSQYGAHRVGGLIRDRWAALGWETTSGYPTSEEVDAPGNGGKVTYFAPTTNGRDGQAYGNSAIYWKSGNPAAWSVHGRIYQAYQDLGATTSWLGYPISNEYHPTLTPTGASAPADAWQTDFENGVIYGDPRTGYTAAPKAGASLPVRKIDDSVTGSGDLQFDYSGNWSTCNGCDNGQGYENGFHYAYDVGSAVVFRFSTPQATIYGVRGDTGGIARVSVDGGAPVDVDLYAASYQYGAMFTTPVLAAGNHSVRVEVSGRKNSASTGTGVGIDWAQVGGATQSQRPPVTVEDSQVGSGANSFEYSGYWNECVNCSAASYTGNYHYSGNAGDKFVFRFTGVRATLWAAVGDSAGIVSVGVDSEAPEIIDLFSDTYEVQPFFITPTMSYGSHIVTVTVTGDRNSAATNMGASIDRAEVVSEEEAGVTDEGSATADSATVNSLIADQGADPRFAEVQDWREPVLLDSPSCEAAEDPSEEVCIAPLSPEERSLMNSSATNGAATSDGSAVVLDRSDPDTWCSRQKGSKQDRRHLCDSDGFAVVRGDKVTKKETGRTVIFYESHLYVSGRLKAEQIMRASVKFTVVERTGPTPPATSSTGRVAFSCANCEAGIFPDASQVLPLTVNSSRTWRLNAGANVAPGKSNVAAFTFAFTASVPNALNPVTTYKFRKLKMRCDDAVGSYAGCVNNQVRAAAVFSRSADPELSSHIAWAIKTGLPDVLIRASGSRSVVDSRRRSTCPKNLERVSVGGKDWTCDEYPFATTLQGGLTPVRVPPGCRLKVQGASVFNPSRSGTSRCLVPQEQQNHQGAILSEMAQYERVLQNDKYLVQVVN